MTDSSSRQRTVAFNIEGASETFTLPVYLLGNETPAAFANNLSINGNGHIVQIDFLQVLPPSIDDEDDVRRLQETGIPGHVIGRVVVPDEVFRAFVFDMAAKLTASPEKEES